MGEAFDGEHQARDAHGGILNFRRQAADRAPRGAPPQHGVQRRAIHGPRQCIERFERYGRIRQRFRDGDVQAAFGEPVANRLLAFRLLDRGPHTGHRRSQASLANRIDRRELRIGQREGAQRTRRALAFFQAVFEQRRAAFDGRCRVVQLVRQSRRQFPERDHFFVVQVAGSEGADAVQHGVDQDRRDLMALGDHRAQVVAMHHQHLGGLLRERIARWAGNAGVREYAGDVARPPFHDFPRPGAPVDEYGEAPRQHHE